MSAQNFYQTLYQNDAIFRLADESWDPVISPNPLATDTAVELPAETPLDLLAELDTLSAASTAVYAEPLLIDAVVEIPIIPAVPPQPKPIVSITTPEPLPQPVPRPTTPSILPPIQQQPRLPQLNHKVLLLADEDLDPSNLLFLEKILKAVNLNINGVDLLNLHGVQEVDFAELLRGKYINHFITFGVPFERISLDIMMDRYAPVRFEGITFLMADSLPTIEADQNLKKRLWAALQRMFLR
ncbi:hypothetical protein [Spirosoma validum]|uniref:Uncharacterized protein n=1 Tax=Spirosoma validum TaxID=2771355 RepID=A0A927B7R6_9BACT|nr:hypothetical protein [Spirosoma validum]MBD2756838.1 hypothetical protein [Spirosoma validum]